jgi:GxxExxY protein
MSKGDLLHGEITRSVIAAFYEVYNVLGYGFVESIYGTSLEGELLERGHAVSREHAIHVTYKGREAGFQRADMVVDGLVIVELKATPALPAFAERQLMNYLRGTRLEVGLLRHFGPKPVFHRVVSFNHQPPA